MITSKKKKKELDKSSTNLTAREAFMGVSEILTGEDIRRAVEVLSKNQLVTNKMMAESHNKKELLLTFLKELIAIEINDRVEIRMVENWMRMAQDFHLRFRFGGEMIGVATSVDAEVHNHPEAYNEIVERVVKNMLGALDDFMATWVKIAKQELSFKEIIAIQNIEQRMAALKMYGVEKILHDTKAVLVEKSKRGNELYKIPFIEGTTANIFSQDAYYLKYSDPSTGRIYISGVPPEMGQTKSADACMAWKHGLSTDAYKLLFNEA